MPDHRIFELAPQGAGDIGIDAGTLHFVGSDEAAGAQQHGAGPRGNQEVVVRTNYNAQVGCRPGGAEAVGVDLDRALIFPGSIERLGDEEIAGLVSLTRIAYRPSGMATAVTLCPFPP